MFMITKTTCILQCTIFKKSLMCESTKMYHHSHVNEHKRCKHDT